MRLQQRRREAIQLQHKRAFGVMADPDLASLVASLFCLAQDRFDPHGRIEQIWPSLALKAREAVEIKDVVTSPGVVQVREAQCRQRHLGVDLLQRAQLDRL